MYIKWSIDNYFFHPIFFITSYIYHIYNYFFRCKDVLTTCPFYSPLTREPTTTLFHHQLLLWHPQLPQLHPCYCLVHQPLTLPQYLQQQPQISKASTFISQTVQNQGNYTSPTLHYHLHFHIQPSLSTSLLHTLQPLPHHHHPLSDSIQTTTTITNPDTPLPHQA